MKMVNDFKTWWSKPTKAADRIKAMIIGCLAGFWIGLITPFVVISEVVPFSVIGYSILSSIIVMGILGLIFPKIIITIFYPFAYISIGGN
jgi:uncharacterized membrane protein